MEEKTWWTTRELAEEAERRGRPVSQQHIRDSIRDGTLAGEKVGRDWLIPNWSARRWLELWVFGDY